ncbi:MAG: hypothetical protein JO256_04925 [Alphaproteobacteria bacterium]|nr:hypothetical protein [Alphaproteobacteria bacterium]
MPQHTSISVFQRNLKLAVPLVLALGCAFLAPPLLAQNASLSPSVVQLGQVLVDARQAEQQGRKMATMASINQTLGSVGQAQAGGTRTEIFGVPGGLRYEGEVDGFGTLTGGPDQDYREYHGQVRAILRSGLGVSYGKDGTVQVGRFEFDRLNGYGARYDAQGKLLEQGLYERGILKTPVKGN